MFNAMMQDTGFGEEQALAMGKDFVQWHSNVQWYPVILWLGMGIEHGWRPLDGVTRDHCLGRETNTTCCVGLCALDIGHWHLLVDPSPPISLNMCFVVHASVGHWPVDIVPRLS